MTVVELAALARRAQRGDSDARHALLVELYGAVRKHLYLVLGTGALADDAVQDTMLALHRGLAGFRGDTASPRTWALAIATRIAYRLRRRESRYQLVDDGTVDVGVLDVEPVAAAELTMLRKALATLSPRKRDAFVLMAIFELSAQEAGGVLGTFANTAASRFRHARAELEARLRARTTKFDEPVAVRATDPAEP
jgi:RNA polymerase sigma-70 factor (ECF subfamily)